MGRQNLKWLKAPGNAHEGITSNTEQWSNKEVEEVSQ